MGNYWEDCFFNYVTFDMIHHLIEYQILKGLFQFKCRENCDCFFDLSNTVTVKMLKK